VKSLKAFLFFLGTGVAGLLAALAAAATSFFRKSDAQAASEKLEVEVKSHDVAAALRAKVAEVVAQKAQAHAEQEKARDTVDVANDLIGSLSAGAPGRDGGC